MSEPQRKMPNHISILSIPGISIQEARELADALRTPMEKLGFSGYVTNVESKTIGIGDLKQMLIEVIEAEKEAEERLKSSPTK